MSRLFLIFYIPAIVIVISWISSKPGELLTHPNVTVASAKPNFAKPINKPISESIRERAWDLRPSQTPPAFKPVTLRYSVFDRSRVKGAALNTNLGIAIVSVQSRKHLQSFVGIYCDLLSGKMVSNIWLPRHYVPTSVDPSGRYAIFAKSTLVDFEKEVLYIADFQDTGEPKLRRWCPLLDPEAQPKAHVSIVDASQIAWASFVGSDRIVTLTTAGRLDVWSFPDKKCLGSVPGIIGRPALTPDGLELVVGTASDELLLIDPSSPIIKGKMAVSHLPEGTELAIHPDAKSIAVGGRCKADDLRIQGDSFVVALPNGEATPIQSRKLQTDSKDRSVPELGWVDDYLVCRQKLYDVQSLIPIWNLNGTDWAAPYGRTYFSASQNKQKDTVLRCLNIPMKEINARIKNLKKRSDIVMLEPGDAVQIDVSRLPKNRQQEVKEWLVAQARERGFIPVESSPIVIQASEGEERTIKKSYRRVLSHRGTIADFIAPDWDPNAPFRYLRYKGREARLQILKNETSIWRRWQLCKAPSFIESLPSDGWLDYYADPDYKLYSNARLPKFLLDGGLKRSLGQTRFYADGTSRSYTARLSKVKN